MPIVQVMTFGGRQWNEIPHLLLLLWVPNYRLVDSENLYQFLAFDSSWLG